MSDAYTEEIEDIEEFPEKSEFGSLSRKRNAIRIAALRAKKMAQAKWWRAGAFLTNTGREYCDNESDGVYWKRIWRTSRSGKIKKLCNRRLRRNTDIQIESITKERAAYRKETEFWWEYL